MAPLYQLYGAPEPPEAVQVAVLPELIVWVAGEQTGPPPPPQLPVQPLVLTTIGVHGPQLLVSFDSVMTPASPAELLSAQTRR